MDRLTWTCWGLMLSVISVAVVAYRNDLSTTNRHGCIWSTIEHTNMKESTTTGSTSSGNVGSGGRVTVSNPVQGLLLPSYIPGSNSAGGSLNCNLRTLSVDFWNYTFNREQIEQTRVVRIKCSDKIYFESLLSPNQTLFQLRNLKEVQIESCKIRKVPRKVWASLIKLKTLVIRTQNTEWRSSSSVGLEIESGAFEGLGQLEALDLSNSNIWTLQNALCPLRSLIKLNVSHNRLSEIEELSSVGNLYQNDDSSSSINQENCGLNVQILDLSYNSLRRVRHNAFIKIKRLTELRLENNLIGELEDSAFGSLNQVKLMNLSSNKLVALPPSIFKSNSNLRELYLQNNSISALSSQVFSKMEQLLLLDLSRNTLTSQWIKEDVFHGLIRLVVIKLSWNELSYIDSIVFRDLISLQALYLNNNNLETINQEAFNSLINLHILDLSNNRLTYVDSKVFSRLFVLRQLYLDHNKIRKMDDNSLKNCTSLQDLGIADNGLTEVPVALRAAGLGLLKTIDIGENKIIEVSNSSFAGMSQLYGLRMADCHVKELPAGFCEPLKNLRVINFSQNKISQISSSAFTSCPDLRVLRLDTNLLEELPPTLASQLPTLLWLNVSENRLKWADYHFLPATIEWLDLSYNSIESLTGPLSTMGEDKIKINTKKSSNPIPYHLRVLDLSYNKLKHLDHTAIPSSLETLRANHNELRTIAQDTFMQNPRIRRVELKGNKIENLPLASLRLQPIPLGRTLPEFYLGDNPFLCDCTMEWLTRVNQLSPSRTHPRIVDLDAIVCRTTFSQSKSVGSNSSTAVIPLVEARPSDFLCQYKSHCFALCHCCEFEFCDCEMTCPDNCFCHHDTAWSSNIVECSNAKYETIPARIPMDATAIYLDGNRLFQLGSHIFIGKKNLRTLFLNDSHVEFIKNKTFNGLKSLESLHLQENLLTELQGYEFTDLENLRELYLQNNLLRFIAPDTFINLKFIQVIRLDGNHLVDFNVWELTRNGYLNSVMLAGNPWSCECEFLIPYRNWVATKTAIVVDFTLAKCQMLTEGDEDAEDQHATNSQQLKQLQPTISSMCNSPLSPDITFNYDDTKDIEINNHISTMGGAAEKAGSTLPIPQLLPQETENSNALWTFILCLSAVLIIIFLALLMFRREIFEWLIYFSSRICCCCCPGKSGRPKLSCPSTGGDEQEKLFDAYFLYGRNDEDVLVQKIAPELELPTTGSGSKFRLCLHYRDLCLSPESPWNREMILSACDASKRVVIVLSRSFLQSEWASSSHFRSSIQTAISLHQKKLIFILLPPFTDQNLSEISPELTKNLKNSCIHWNDKNFWPKFRQLLPFPVISNLNQCEPNQLSYNLVMNPNLHQHQFNSNMTNTISGQHYHYHQNIIPYQIPMMNRNNSLPPIPKHQIVLPAPMNWHQDGSNTLGGHLNNHLQQHHQHNHNTIISPNLIHPIPSHLTPQPFGYSNEPFHLQQSNHHQNHHPGHNNNQPIHFSSQQNSHPILLSSVIPPHSSSQVSNSGFSSVCYPNTQIEQNYSSSAVSSCANDEFDHVYSTLDSPLQSPGIQQSSEIIGFCPNGRGGSEICAEGNGNGVCRHNHLNNRDINCSNKVNQHHKTQHSTSSGISSGSDVTSGSSAVSPSSPIKNGILNKLNGQSNNNGLAASNGKMYFV